METPIQNEDLYKLFNIAEDASGKEITKAYRSAALKCHPDKNPDDPQAAHKFRRLSEALQLLTDAAARAAYDRVRQARRAAAERARALGEGRRRFKEQLEAAEAAAAANSAAPSSGRRGEDEAKLEREMKRLRRDWDDVIAKEQERLGRQMREAAAAAAAPAAEAPPTLKLTWRGGDSAELHTEASLMKLCSAYGQVSSLLVRPGKRRGGICIGVALVEFQQREAARRMVESTTLPDGLSAVWLQGERPPAPTVPAAAAVPPPSAESLRHMESDVLARMMARSSGVGVGGKRPHSAENQNAEVADTADTTAAVGASE